MFSALTKAVHQLVHPGTEKLLLMAVSATLLLSTGFWFVITFVLIKTSFFETNWLEWLMDFMGGAFALALTWLLFPVIISTVIGFLLERVADAVDTCYYPHLSPPRTRALSEIIIQSTRFLILLLVINVLLLPLLFIPPLFPCIFYFLNGYLLGREYFELVALRRISPSEAQLLRKKKRTAITTIGIFFALLMTLPGINLLTPIIATATMIHLLEDWCAHARAGPKTV